jgi:iron(III) transport system ATP-binding protein
MTDAFLNCHGLTKRFGPVTAVDSVSLEVEQGHTFALLGPSGCGKTTLLRLVAGFERPDGGGIRIGDRVVSGQGVFVSPNKRRVGMVFQDYALFPHLNVESNVAFGLPRGNDRKRRVAELLEIVGLGGLGRRMPHEISGGQQQRVALARCLAAEPDLVLLDEPFSNLDPGMRVRVRAEVRQILESLGITAVFVTHDQEEALSLAERVGVMLHGRIVQCGRPADVYMRPAGRAVAEFLGDANFLTGSVEDGVVRCELGALRSADHLSGSVDIMVRPESLVLAEDGVPVRVANSEYFGHDQLVTVVLPSGGRLKVRLLPARDLAPGQQLGLRMAGDFVVFPAARS